MARLIRPVLPTYSGVNAHSRDAGRRISDLHDAHAATETLDDHVRPAAEADGALDGDRLDGIREALVERRDALAAARDLEARLVDVRADLVEERERVDDPPSRPRGTTPSAAASG